MQIDEAFQVLAVGFPGLGSAIFSPIKSHRGKIIWLIRWTPQTTLLLPCYHELI